MELSLRQITNTIPNHINSPKKLTPLKIKPQIHNQLTTRFPFKRLVHISVNELDFGLCIPNTVHERVISLNLREDLSEPLGFVMMIVCQDEKLNNLPQFVFAVKKDKELEFTDCYRFRLSKRGKYDFVIGVKTPNLVDYRVKSQLRISTQLSDLNNSNQLYSVKLQQSVCLPVIECPRQLYSSKETGVEPLRVLKFSQIRAKLKKQVKIPFKLETDTKLILINQFMGIQHEMSEIEQNLIEIQPKQIHMAGKGIFMMTFRFNFTEEMSQYLQILQDQVKSKEEIVSYTLRRILVMRVNHTSIHFHFPMEVNFFLGNKRTGYNSSE